MASPEDDPSRRRRWLLPSIIAAGAIVIAGVGIGVFASGGLRAPAESAAAAEDTPNAAPRDKSVSEEPIDSVTIAPPPAPLSEDEAAEVARAETTVASLVAVVDEISERADGSTVGIDAIATGWVRGELESRAREQLDLGYRQIGEAVITGIDATDVDLESEPATITLKVCVDVSGIDVLDAAGNSLKESLYDPGHPVAHIYGAVFEDDTWKISTHDIPDTQDCVAD